MALVANEFRAPFAAVHFEIALLRLLFAAGLGAAIGFEREIHANSAGLRTHMIVSMAACLFTLIAAEIMAGDFNEAARVQTDPLRLIEAVTAGVAFLAAGSIITSGGRITGLTTGAGMWMAGAIGLACGSGLLLLALLAAGLAIIVLWLLRHVSRRVGRHSGARQDPDTTEAGPSDPADR